MVINGKYYPNIYKYKNKDSEKYRCSITFDGKKKYLGTFDTPEECIEAQQKFKKENKIENDKINKKIEKFSSKEVSHQGWRKTKEYRHWRINVIKRDKCCMICGSKKKRQAHHLKNGNNHPKYRFDVDNGITLCYDCHRNFHTNFKKNYHQKTTEEDFKNFVTLINYIKEIKEINPKLKDFFH